LFQLDMSKQVVVVPIRIDKNPSEDDPSWQKHVMDNWMSTSTITLDGVIEL
jgi:hypothetical protein